MKEKLLDMLLEIADAFDEYALSLESDGDFWKAVNKMEKYIKKNIKEDK